MLKSVTFGWPCLLLLSGLAVVLAESDLVRKTISEHSAHPAIVRTSLGEIKGSLLKTRFNKTIHAFRGIRFAKPPINDLRFQPPQPVENWKGVYDATADRAACPQLAWDPPITISEDCLFLNVYTTKLPKGHDNPRRPVIVFFHAGGFYGVTGASFLEGPQYLLDQDIVLVVANYRLGSLGFLSTGTKEAPGNNALKDQVLVLHWIKDNIAAFGGNPNAVTISGYSAGGISVIEHLVSPLSKGLFHRAIVMSGSLFGTWPMPSEQLSIAKKQARILNCPDDRVADMIKCLKTKPAEGFGSSLPSFAEFGNEPILVWSPVIERDFGQPRFLTEDPVKSILEGRFEKVPVMIGLTAEEFAGRAFDIVGNQSLLKELDEDFERVAPISFLYERNTPKSKEISKAIRSFYFGGGKLDASSRPALSNLFSDSIVGFGINRAAKILSEKNTDPVYYYCFNFTGRASHFYLPGTNNTVPYGPVHHDDLIYLFPSNYFPYYNQPSPEYDVVNKLTTMWGNFAKSGNPTIHKVDGVIWEPFTKNHQRYLDIGPKLSIRENLYDERYSQWETILPLPN